jgi:hypothetical protein
MLPIPWYYKWTESERFLHEIMQATVSAQPEFELRPMLNDENKVDTIIHALIESQAKSNQYMLFTSNDLIVKPGVYTALKKHLDAGNDMAFLNDDCNGSMGFMLLKVTHDIIGFWKTVRSGMGDSVELDLLSADLLASYPGSWAYLDHKVFTFTNTIDPSEPYVVLQLPSSRIGVDEGLEKEFGAAEKIFVAAQHMDVEPYMKYVSEDIIPFIYRFQEIIIRTYQEVAAGNS